MTTEVTVETTRREPRTGLPLDIYTRMRECGGKWDGKDVRFAHSKMVESDDHLRSLASYRNMLFRFRDKGLAEVEDGRYYAVESYRVDRIRVTDR